VNRNDLDRWLTREPWLTCEICRHTGPGVVWVQGDDPEDEGCAMCSSLTECDGRLFDEMAADQGQVELPLYPDVDSGEIPF